MSAPEVAKKAAVDRKTLNNILNERVDARSDIVEAVAGAFKLTAAELLSPNFDANISIDTNLKELITLYQNAHDEGRKAILNVAKVVPARK